MNDDFPVLRETMRDLAAHGGDADLHDRMLRASRRLGRRRRLAGTAAVAVALVAIGTPFALAGTRQSLPDPTDVATEPSITTSPVPSSSPPTTPSAPPSAPPSAQTSATPSTTPGATDEHGGCPVTQQTLFQVIRAAGTTPKPGDRYRDIECHDGYASGTYVEKVPVGDPGRTVFAYHDGKWTVVGWGSGDVCDAYLPRDVWSSFDMCAFKDPSEPCPIGSAEAVDAVRDSRYADRVDARSWAEQLACGDRYAVVRLNDRETTVIMSWSRSANRWSVVEAGPCREVVTTKYAAGSVCE